jgi:F0F1-type ATP synthase gamma subunit
MIGEWNDCINNDIMTFKRDVIEPLMCEGISKFILIGENVLNFHESDDCYYEEWFDEVEDMDGWIALLNFREHVIEVFEEANIDSYFVLGGKMNNLGWRTLTPTSLFNKVKGFVMRRLGTGGDYNGF